MKIKSKKDSFETQDSVSNQVSIDLEDFVIESETCRLQAEQCYQQAKNMPVSRHEPEVEKSILDKIHIVPQASQKASENPSQHHGKRMCTEERINRCCSIAFFKFFPIE